MGPRKEPPPQSFQLIMSGPKTILPEPVTVTAELDYTWYQLLNDKMGLQITPEAGLFVCTSRYSRMDPDNRLAWCAELTDRIGDYIEKFEKNWSKFTARLAFRNPQNWTARNPTTSRSQATKGRKRRSPIQNGGTIKKRQNNPERSSAPTVAPSRRPNIVIPIQTSVTTSNIPNRAGARNRPHLNQVRRQQQNIPPVSQQLLALRAKSAASTRSIRGRNQALQIANIPSDVKIEPANEQNELEIWIEEPAADPLEEPAAGGSDSGQGDDDNLSTCTAATAEETELRRQGIQVEDAKLLATSRMSRFSNAYLLRVRNEMRKLKRNNMWDRCVSRAPLACYLLQEMFKD